MQTKAIKITSELFDLFTPYNMPVSCTSSDDINGKVSAALELSRLRFVPVGLRREVGLTAKPQVVGSVPLWSKNSRADIVASSSFVICVLAPPFGANTDIDCHLKQFFLATLDFIA